MILNESETWTINKKEKNMLEVLEIWCWRKIQRTSWTERKKKLRHLEYCHSKKKNIDRYSNEKDMADDRTRVEV